jgi:hypothetical protein
VVLVRLVRLFWRRHLLGGDHMGAPARRHQGASDPQVPALSAGATDGAVAVVATPLMNDLLQFAATLARQAARAEFATAAAKLERQDRQGG